MKFIANSLNLIPFISIFISALVLIATEVLSVVVFPFLNYIFDLSLFFKRDIL